jgi:demethylmenaquinone methyltransferase/2-methoxy-6-polyprenyl-1,4-benzoquinol methylase
MNKDLVQYYALRAAEYELVFEKPERQKDLQRMQAILLDVFRDKSVLEIACGTGWFTQRLIQTTKFVLATDINEAVLECARDKNLPAEKAQFQQDDIFNSSVDQQFEGLFAGFIWSHILLDQLDTFLKQCLQWVKPGGVLVFTDNFLIPGSSSPLHHTDADGNSYQLRRLQNGTEHLVLKNFPTETFLSEIFEQYTDQVEVLTLGYYWMVVCRRP